MITFCSQIVSRLLSYHVDKYLSNKVLLSAVIFEVVQRVVRIWWKFQMKPWVYSVVHVMSYITVKLFYLLYHYYNAYQCEFINTDI